MAATIDERRDLGVFYTPDALVDLLVARCVPARGRPRVLDPACGDGAFLRGVLRHSPQAVPIGLELDPAAARLAAQSCPGTARVLTGDALARGKRIPGGLVDAVVGNPPYVRSRRLSEARRADLRRRFEWATGQFDLTVPFLERSLSWLKPGGRLGFVLPNKVLVSAYARKMRQALVTEHRIVEVVDLAAEERAFGDACAYPVLLVVERRSSRPDDRVTVAEARLRRGRVATEASRELLLADWRPGAPARMDAAAEAVWSRQDLPSFDQVATAREAVHTGNLRAKLVLQPPSRRGVRLLRGRDVRRWRTDWAGLRLREDLQPDRGRGEYARVPPAEMFTAPKILLREIAARPTAAYDDQGLRCLNKAYVVRTRERPSPARLMALTAVINSTPFARLFAARYAAGSLRGGHLQFKPQWVGETPLPDLDAAVDAGIDRLAAGCARGEALDDEVDRAIGDLYGWPSDDVVTKGA